MTTPCLGAPMPPNHNPPHLVFGEEVVLPIERKIPSLHLAVQLLPDTQPLEQRLIMLERASEYRRVALQTMEAAKKRTKAQYDQKVQPQRRPCFSM